MEYSKQEILRSLRVRIRHYEKAIQLVNGEIPWENGFDWPTYPGDHHGSPENLYYWRGAVAEMKNTVAMLEHA